MISVYFNGRLGNQIFQYITTRVLAKMNSTSFWVPKNKEEAIEFYSLMCSKFGLNLEMPVETNPHYWIGDELFEIDFGINDREIDIIINKSFEDNRFPSECLKNSLLIGFFQSDFDFIQYREEIIKWLKFNEEVKKASEKFLKKYSIDDYCYIHFRGDDYKNLKKFYLPKDYYFKAIYEIRAINKELNFLIITDDILEAESIFTNFDIISNTTNIDFYLISKSKYTIIPNSTFSWWASWLNMNNIITIAPNRWYNYNSKDKGFLPNGINTKLFTYID